MVMNVIRLYCTVCCRTEVIEVLYFVVLYVSLRYIGVSKVEDICHVHIAFSPDTRITFLFGFLICSGMFDFYSEIVSLVFYSRVLSSLTYSSCNDYALFDVNGSGSFVNNRQTG